MRHEERDVTAWPTPIAEVAAWRQLLDALHDGAETRWIAAYADRCPPPTADEVRTFALACHTWRDFTASRPLDVQPEVRA
jgi:hypothetical protein